MFGAKKGDLPEIWDQFIAGELESGRPYGKTLRSVKSCDGITDSVLKTVLVSLFVSRNGIRVAPALNALMSGILAPYRIKGSVSR
jgi:NAD(P)H-nitrite reductase large subunit